MYRPTPEAWRLALHSACAVLVLVAISVLSGCTPAGNNQPDPPLVSGTVFSMDFSPDGEYLAIGSAANNIHPYNMGRIWNIQECKERMRLILGGGPALAIRFSPDGSKIATGSFYRLWDFESGRCIFQSDIRGPAYVLEFSAQGDIVATGSGYRTIYLWSVPAGEIVGKLEGHTGTVSALAFSPTQDILASGGDEDDRTIRIWDYHQQKLLHTLTSRVESEAWNAHRIVGLKFFPDGKRLASFEMPAIMRIWDVTSGKQIRRWNVPIAWATGFDISPDGKTVATGGSGHIIYLWDPKTSALQQRLSFDETGLVFALAFSPDGTTLAAAINSKIGLFDLKTGQLATTLDLIFKDRPPEPVRPAPNEKPEIKAIFLRLDEPTDSNSRGAPDESAPASGPSPK